MLTKSADALNFIMKWKKYGKCIVMNNKGSISGKLKNTDSKVTDLILDRTN